MGPKGKAVKEIAQQPSLIETMDQGGYFGHSPTQSKLVGDSTSQRHSNELNCKVWRPIGPRSATDDADVRAGSSRTHEGLLDPTNQTLSYGLSLKD